MPITKLLLKNGIGGLIEKDDGYFKENICQALAFKLNESLEQTQKDAASVLLLKSFVTPESKELNEFIDFVQNFKSGRYEFKNNTVLNITESEINAVKSLFESLSSKNRQIMVQEIFNDSGTFRKHIDFYNETKGLMV